MGNWFKNQTKTAGSMYQTHARYMGETSFSIWIPLQRENEPDLVNQAFQKASQAVGNLGEGIQMDLNPTYDFERVYR